MILSKKWVPVLIDVRVCGIADWCQISLVYPHRSAFISKTLLKVCMHTDAERSWGGRTDCGWRSKAYPHGLAPIHPLPASFRTYPHRFQQNHFEQQIGNTRWPLRIALKKLLHLIPITSDCKSKNVYNLWTIMNTVVIFSVLYWIIFIWLNIFDVNFNYAHW